MAGTKWYAAPEIFWRNGEQTPKVDIYSLGATVVECLVELLPEAEREARWPQWQQWYQDLQTVLNQLEPRMAPMLADVADQRPTARQLLQDFSRQSPYTSLRGPQTNTTLSSPITLYEPGQQNDSNLLRAHCHGLDTNESHGSFPAKSSATE